MRERSGPIRDRRAFDITARKRAEEERLRLQDEGIRVQAAALAERGRMIPPAARSPALAAHRGFVR